MRKFNVTGLCNPSMHYMIDTSNKINQEAFEQIARYLDSKNKDTGYLLTFDFRKTQNIGKPQIKWVEHKGKKILDVMVGV
jgi:hypothetical protein